MVVSRMGLPSRSGIGIGVSQHQKWCSFSVPRAPVTLAGPLRLARLNHSALPVGPARWPGSAPGRRRLGRTGDQQTGTTAEGSGTTLDDIRHVLERFCDGVPGPVANSGRGALRSRRAGETRLGTDEGQAASVELSREEYRGTTSRLQV